MKHLAAITMAIVGLALVGCHSIDEGDPDEYKPSSLESGLIDVDSLPEDR